MENKISLIIRHALGIVSIIILIFIGLEMSVWQDAPQTYRSRFILFLLMAILVFTSDRLEKRKQFREDIGMEEQCAEGKVSKALRTVFRTILYLILIAFIVSGVLFRNQTLSLYGGVLLALMVILHFVGVRRERKKKQAAQKQESTPNEPPSGPAQ